ASAAGFSFARRVLIARSRCESRAQAQGSTSLYRSADWARVVSRYSNQASASSINNSSYASRCPATSFHLLTPICENPRTPAGRQKRPFTRELRGETVFSRQTSSAEGSGWAGWYPVRRCSSLSITTCRARSAPPSRTALLQRARTKEIFLALVSIEKEVRGAGARRGCRSGRNT